MPLTATPVFQGTPRPAPAPLADQRQDLAKAAQALEAQFLAEMLKAAGHGKTPEVFGGGPGEDHFASFLREAHAKEMAHAGGLGLTAAILRSLMQGARADG